MIGRLLDGMLHAASLTSIAGAFFLGMGWFR